VTTQHEPTTRTCILDWLSSEHEGLLGYTTGHGRRRIAVRYGICGDGQLVFRLPAYSSAMGYAPDQPVTMEVPMRDERGASRGYLLVSGTASVVSSTDCAPADEVLDEQWPAAVTTRVLTLRATAAEHVPAEPHGRLVGVGARHQDGTVGVAHALVADRPEHQLTEPAEPSGPHDEHPRLSRRPDQAHRRTCVVGPARHHDLGVLRHLSSGVRDERSVHRLGELVDGRRVPERPASRLRGRHERPRAENSHGGAEVRRELQSHIQRPRRAWRPVMPHHDARGRGHLHRGLDVVVSEQGGLVHDSTMGVEVACV